MLSVKAAHFKTFGQVARQNERNEHISKSVSVSMTLTKCFDSNLPRHRGWNIDANKVDILVQQDIIRSTGVKGDAELLCQAAGFLFASPPEGVNLKAFIFQQRDQHSGCAPCAKHTDSWQHGNATLCDVTYDTQTSQVLLPLPSVNLRGYL